MEQISSTQKAVELVQRLEQKTGVKGEDLFECVCALLGDITSLNSYQHKANKTAIYPGKGTALGLIYVSLKGCGEAGEFAENVGKALRDDGLAEATGFEHGSTHEFEMHNLTDERRQKLIKELGDRLWYVAQAATELGVTLSEVAEQNLNKLADRQTRGVLKGSGDER